MVEYDGGENIKMLEPDIKTQNPNSEKSTYTKTTTTDHRQDYTQQKWTTLLAVVGYAATIGTSVPVGYCIGNINSPAEFIKSWCNTTVYKNYNTELSESNLDLLWSCIVSIFLAGAAVGSLGGAKAANYFGRKGCLLIIGIFLTVGSLCFFFCRIVDSIEMLLLGRLLVGFAGGLTTTVLPMYLSEIAPANLCGTLGAFCGVGVTGGLVVGQMFSLSQVFGTEEHWHIALSFYMVPLVISYLPFWLFPESPKYLYIMRGDRKLAIRELERLRGANNTHIIEQEVEEMNIELKTTAAARSCLNVLCDEKLLLPLIIVCAYQGGQQLSGINAIFYYSVSIFEKAGFSKNGAQWANFGAGCVNLASAFMSIVLVAKYNRRPLMLFSTGLCAICLFLISFFLTYIDSVSWFAFACIASIILYIFFFQFGVGPIPYFIGTELCEVQPRPVAMSMGSLSSWGCNLIIGMGFPLLQSIWGAYVFLLFSLVCVLLFVLTKFYLPETRGRDTAEVALLVSKGFKSKVL